MIFRSYVQLTVYITWTILGWTEDYFVWVLFCLQKFYSLGISDKCIKCIFFVLPCAEIAKLFVLFSSLYNTTRVFGAINLQYATYFMKNSNYYFCFSSSRLNVAFCFRYAPVDSCTWFACFRLSRNFVHILSYVSFYNNFRIRKVCLETFCIS